MEVSGNGEVHLMRHASHYDLGKCTNVLVLYTGGTIGMYSSEEGIFVLHDLSKPGVYFTVI